MGVLPIVIISISVIHVRGYAYLYLNGQNEFGHQLWEFICDSGCPRHVERNYVPLFGVQTAWHNRTSTYVIT